MRFVPFSLFLLLSFSSCLSLVLIRTKLFFLRPLTPSFYQFFILPRYHLRVLVRKEKKKKKNHTKKPTKTKMEKKETICWWNGKCPCFVCSLSFFFLFFPLLPPLLLYPTFTQPLPTQSVLGDSRLFLERQEKMDRSIDLLLLLLLHLYNNTWTCPTLASQLLLYSFPDKGGGGRGEQMSAPFVSTLITTNNTDLSVCKKQNNKKKCFYFASKRIFFCF